MGSNWEPRIIRPKSYGMVKKWEGRLQSTNLSPVYLHVFIWRKLRKLYRALVEWKGTKSLPTYATFGAVLSIPKLSFLYIRQILSKLSVKRLEVEFSSLEFLPCSLFPVACTVLV